jgi:hypothetical protein
VAAAKPKHVKKQKKYVYATAKATSFKV